jgi:hypothetical protein
MRLIILPLIFISSFGFAQKLQISKKDSFNIYLKERGYFQEKVGNNMLLMSGLIFAGTITYWKLGEPEAPDPILFPTLSQFNSANNSYQDKLRKYKFRRGALGIAGGLVFVTGSILRASGKLRQDIYLSRKYSFNIGMQDYGIGMCMFLN